MPFDAWIGWKEAGFYAMPVLPDWATLANSIDVCKIPILFVRRD